MWVSLRYDLKKPESALEEHERFFKTSKAGKRWSLSLPPLKHIHFIQWLSSDDSAF